MIYTTRWFTQEFIESDLAQYPLWIANYPATPSANPSSMGPWSSSGGDAWKFQQYHKPSVGDPPNVSGIEFAADLDVFNGDSAALDAFINPAGYTISARASPPPGGMVGTQGSPGAGSLSIVATADSLTLTATASSGYTFVNWSENDTVVSTSADYAFTPDSDRTLIANFVDNSVNLTIVLNTASPAAGTLSGAGSFAPGSLRTVTATANSGYTFVNWTEKDGVVSSSASYTFTLNGNRSLVANFVQCCVIAVSASPPAAGTVSGGGAFSAGSSRTVMAAPNNRFAFVNWTEGGSQVSTSTAYNFTLSTNRSLVANFLITPAPTCSLGANPTSIIEGQTSTLSWTSTNANSCTGNNFSTGGTTSGNISVAPTQTTTYTASCSGTGGTNACTPATITVTPSLMLQVTPPTGITAVGNPGGPFDPASFAFQLSATTGNITFSISNLPAWLTASQTSGSVGTTPTTVTLNVNAAANAFPIGTHGPTTITFNNTFNGRGTQQRNAMLGVNGACTFLSPLRDFNGDGSADILFHRNNGQLSVYLTNGAQALPGVPAGTIGLEWTIVGVGDFNGDGRADFLTRRPDGSLAVFLMNGTQIVDAQIIGKIGTDWRVVGVGDFNGDGRADFLTHRPDGLLGVFLMDGLHFIGAAVIGQIGTEWSVIGVADLNGDGRADFLTRRGDGKLGGYLMNGLELGSGQIVGTIGTEWTPVALADFNGDGRADLMTRRVDGTLALYLMNSGQIFAADVIGNIGTEWRFLGSGDFSGDGRADFLARHTDGRIAFYQLNGFTILPAQVLGTLGTDWESCYGQSPAGATAQAGAAQQRVGER